MKRLTLMFGLMSWALLCGADEIHVSPTGKDSQSGTKANPVATVPRAQSLVRELTRNGLQENVHVVIAPGRYELTEPLVFHAADGGTKDFVVTYSGKGAILSGGRTVTGWREGENNVWTVPLPDVKAGTWHFRQLWKNGQRLRRGRYPNKGFLSIKTVKEQHTEFTFNEALPSADPSNKNMEMICILNWAQCRGIVSELSEGVLKTKTPMAWVGHGQLSSRPGLPCYLENHPDFLVQPGDWYLDADSGVLSYKAAEDENPNTETFIAPVLERLMTVEGTSDAPVQNLVFEGLTFEYAEWSLPAIGYRGIQAGYHGTIEKPRPGEPVFCQPAAIELRHADACRFELCTVRHTGASAIGIGEGCRSNFVTGCVIEDVGANGIHIGHRVGPLHSKNNILDKDWDTPRQVPTGNTVRNCVIRRCGQTSVGGVGIFAAFVDHTTIAHNKIYDLPYTGISIGFRWSTIPSSMKNCVVEYNHIHDVMQEVADGGAIYTLGLQPDTFLRGNHIHDVRRSDYGHGSENNGIFLDMGSKALTIEGNIVYRTSGKPVRHHQNSREWHTWKDNSFGTLPDNKLFPSEQAAMAGLETDYREKLADPNK